MVNNFLKKKWVVSVFWNTIIFILGILLCAMKGDALRVLERVIAVFFMIYGAASLVLFYSTSIVIRDSQDFIEDILILVFGIVLFFFSNIFIFGVGIILLFEGLKGISFAMDLRKIKDDKWWLDFVSGCVIALLGLLVVILCNTEVARNIISLLLGISLILTGASNLVIALTLKRDYNTVRKFVKESEDGFTDYEIK